MGLIFKADSRGFTCRDCNRNTKCSRLCPPMAWATAQVEIEPGKERSQDPQSMAKRDSNQQWPEMPGTTIRVLQFYFLHRMDSSEIADALYISKRYVNKIIQEYKIKMTEIIKKSVPG